MEPRDAGKFEGFVRLAEDLALREKVAPAVVVAAAKLEGSGGFRRAFGAAGRLAYGDVEAPASIETPFDLASVTKPVTALAVARLVRRGVLAWSTPLSELLPETAPTPSGPVPIELLLAHRAGLEAHRLLGPVDALAEAARARRQECRGPVPPEGFPPVYSDLGYILVGEGLARRFVRALDTILDEEVARPLGIGVSSARLFSDRDPSFGARVAATEIVPRRGGVVRGLVHDENAWALTGEGASGHAGLFGTARDVLGLGEALLDAMAGRLRGFLTSEEIEPMLRVRSGGTLRAGLDGKSETGSSAGSRFGRASVGHLGFTGVSLWVDPEQNLAGVLLTNRVHPTRASDAIRLARPRVYDAIAAWAEQE